MSRFVIAAVSGMLIGCSGGFSPSLPGLKHEAEEPPPTVEVEFEEPEDDPVKALEARAEETPATLEGWTETSIYAPVFTTPPYEMLITPGPAAWTSGHGVAVDGDRLFVLDRANGRLVVIQRITGDVLARIALGYAPEQLVVSPGGVAYLTVPALHRVVRVDPTYEVSSVEVPAEPFGIAMSHDADRLYVTCTGADRLVTLDVATLGIVADAPTQSRPLGVTVASDGRIHVGHIGGRVLRFDPDGSTEHHLRRFTAHEGYYGVTPMFAQDSVASGARSLAASPWDSSVFAAHTRAYTGIQISCTSYYGSTICPQAPTGQVIVGAITSLPGGTAPPPGKVAPDTYFSTEADMTGPELMLLPYDIVHHPTRGLLFVTDVAMNRIIVFLSSAADPMERPVALINTDSMPRSVAFSPDGDTAYVELAGDCQVGRIDLTGLWSGKGDVVQDHQLRYADDEADLDWRIGQRAFHSARMTQVSNGRFACASCHPDGRDDARVWQSSNGLSQTRPLADLHGTGPFGWYGQASTLHQYVAAACGRMGGLSPMSSATMLMPYVASLTRPANPTELSPAAQRGKDLFDGPAQCFTCHPGGDTNNLGAVLPGVVVIDTPSLAGIGASAPYLHDGSAETLMEVLEVTSDWMGAAFALTQGEKDDLVAYLKTL